MDQPTPALGAFTDSVTEKEGNETSSVLRGTGNEERLLDAEEAAKVLSVFAGLALSAWKETALHAQARS